MKYRFTHYSTGIDKEGNYTGFFSIWFYDLNEGLRISQKVPLTGDMIERLGRALELRKHSQRG